MEQPLQSGVAYDLYQALLTPGDHESSALKHGLTHCNELRLLKPWTSLGCAQPSFVPVKRNVPTSDWVSRSFWSRHSIEKSRLLQSGKISLHRIQGAAAPPNPNHQYPRSIPETAYCARASPLYSHQFFCTNNSLQGLALADATKQMDCLADPISQGQLENVVWRSERSLAPWM